MIKQKKAFLLGETTTKIIIAVLCIVILIILLNKLFNLFSLNQKENLANAELENIISYGNKAIQEKKEENYITTAVADWWLISTEFGEVCNGKFCLCLCNKEDCSEFKSCKATDRFFLLRNKKNIEVREFQLKSPHTLKIIYIEGKVYPFNAGKAVDVKDFSWVKYVAVASASPFIGLPAGILITFTKNDLFKIVKVTTPIFFKFEEEWKWSPDLENWMKLDNLNPVGKWSTIGKLSETNKNFIEAFRELENPKKLSEEIGERFFENSKTYKSDGVIIIIE